MIQLERKKIDPELKDLIERLSGANPLACMKCGKCSGRCPAYDELDYPPHMFVYMVEHGRINELMDSKTIWNCLSCMDCVEKCPRNAKPGVLIEAVRLAVVRQQGMNHITPEDIPEMLDPDLPQQAIVSAYRKYSK